jgi:hypothetical protein
MGGRHSKNRKKGGVNEAVAVAETLPQRDEESQILTEEYIRFLMEYLPGSEFKQNWRRLFNSNKNGASFNRFCYHCTGCGPNIGKNYHL